MEVDMDTSDVSTNREDEGNSVTMVDVLKEQEAFEEDAKAVLGASDDKNCTYTLGYIKRQALYACITCCPNSVTDPSTRAGICLACSLVCHENHELVELYTKRNFRCDCGSPKFPDKPCNFNALKSELNTHNSYNQNFAGLYCVCHRPYPDPESNDDDEMIQCIICEDWLHSKHLNSKVPLADQYSEMICESCMTSNDFLNNYLLYNVKADDKLNESTVSIETNEVDVSATDIKSGTDPENLDSAEKCLPSKINSAETGSNELTPEIENLDSAEKGLLNKIDHIESDINESISEIKCLDSAEQGSMSKIDSVENDLNESVPQIECSNSVDKGLLSKIESAETELNESVPQIESLDSAEKDLLSKIDSTESDLNESVPQIECSDSAENGLLSKIDSAEIDLNESVPQTESLDSAEKDLPSKIDVESDLNELIPQIDQNNSQILKDTIPDSADGGNQLVAIVEPDQSEHPSEIDVNTVNRNNETESQANDTDSMAVETILDQINTEVDATPSSDIEMNYNTIPVTAQDNQVDPAKDTQVEAAPSSDIEMNYNTIPVTAQDNQVDPEKDTQVEAAPSSDIEMNYITVPVTVQDNQVDPEKDTQVEKSPLDSINTAADANGIDCDNIKPAATIVSIGENRIDSSVIVAPDMCGVIPELPNSPRSDASHPTEIENTSDETPVLKECTRVIVDDSINLMESLTDIEKNVSTVVETVESDVEMKELLPTDAEISDVQLSNDNHNDHAMKATILPALINESSHTSKNEEIAVDRGFEINDNIHTSEDKTVSSTVMDINLTDDDSAKMSTESIVAISVPIESENNPNYNSETLTENIDVLPKLDVESGREESASMSENTIDDGCKVDSVEVATVLNGEAADGRENHENSTESSKSKRKLDEELSLDAGITKKQKVDMDTSEIKCIKPSDDKRMQHCGAVFWPNDWRKKLCPCSACMVTYNEKRVSFLLDTEDTVTAYEDLGKIKNSGSSQYEKGLEALSSLGHVQQINAITEYNKMKEKLNEFLTKFKNTNKVVKEEDIKSFFAGMKPKREPDGVYFCH